MNPEHSNRDFQLSISEENNLDPSKVIISIGNTRYNLIAIPNTYTSKDNLVSGSNVAGNGKDWEIVSLNGNIDKLLTSHILNRNANGTFGEYEAEEKDLLMSNLFSIHSVRRLIDNSIWTVNDKVLADDCGVKTIKFFNIAGEDNMLVYDEGSGYWPLKDLKKAPITPLFVTEDGKPIYMGDTQYVVDITTWRVMEDKVRIMPIPSWFESYKTFSTKEAAEEFQLMNKPVLSYQDILNWLDHIYIMPETWDKLKSLTYSKIK